MQTNDLISSEVLAKKDWMLSSIKLLKITTIKKKNLEQVRRYDEKNLPEAMAVVGTYDIEGWKYLLFAFEDDKVGRTPLYSYAVRVLKEERPEIFERPDDPALKEMNYKLESVEVGKKEKELWKILPQIFVD